MAKLGCGKVSFSFPEVNYRWIWLDTLVIIILKFWSQCFNVAFIRKNNVEHGRLCLCFSISYEGQRMSICFSPFILNFDINDKDTIIYDFCYYWFLFPWQSWGVSHGWPNSFYFILFFLTWIIQLENTKSLTLIKGSIKYLSIWILWT